MKSYLKLTKFGIVVLVLLTTIMGYFIAGFHIQGLLFLIFGIYLVSSGSFILNQVYEVALDSKMNRTKNRPLPSGRISYPQALFFGYGFIVAGTILLFFVNLLVVFLTSLTVLLYNFFYTFKWKRQYPYAGVFLGAIPGALPVVIGYSAQTGSFLTLECFYIFLLMFLWQMPHFWSLAYRYKEDYAQADIPVLPLKYGNTQTFFQIGLYTLAYLGVVFLAPFFLNVGIVYLLIVIPFCIKIVFEYYLFYSQKNWLPFFSWMNLSLLIFLSVPLLDRWVYSYINNF